MQATRARVVGGLGVLLLGASLLVPSASAATPEKIRLRGPVTIDSSTWTQEILATDGVAKDSVTVSLSKRLPTDPGTNLRETHSYSFPDLPSDTVEVADNLTGSINIPALSLETGGLLAMDVDLVKIDGVTPKSRCGGEVRRRLVNIADGSSFSLDTLNPVLGDVSGLPETGTFTIERGECAGASCRKLSRALVGVSSRELLGVEETFEWEKRQNFLQDKTTIDVRLERELVSPLDILETTIVGSTIAKVSGTLENGGVGKNATTFNADGLPLLSGQAVLSNLGDVEKGAWTKCSSLEGYRLEDRNGDQSGTLAFSPTGLPTVDLDIDWDTSEGTRQFVNWYELGPGLPPIKP